jgi:hypothetical protein
MWTAIVAAGKFVVDKIKQGANKLKDSIGHTIEQNFSEELAKVRSAGADALAKLGVGAAAKVGPPGNVYSQAQNGQLLILGGLALVMVIVLVSRK